MNARVLPAIIAVAVSLLAPACGRRLQSVDASGSGGVGATGGSQGATDAAPPDVPPVPEDAAGTGGAGIAGTGGAGIAGTGGAGTAGAGNVAGAGGAGGTGGAPTSNADGPCDIYRDARQPCVAAYSTVRRLLSTYAGPLYQIRSGSSDQNTGSGGETLDIGQTADGFADAVAVDAACAGTICTVSMLYDQSGKGNHLSVAKKGILAGGANAAMDDFESSATRESLTVGGHKVYSLYMEPRQGYRLARRGDGIPFGQEPGGIYLLADGTHAGAGCCFDFGDSPPDALTFYDTTALFYGTWGDTGGAGDGPFFMADFHIVISPGGSQPFTPVPANPNNPSLAAKFALGFLKTDAAAKVWALRMADSTTADALTTAFQGATPRPMYNGGAVVLGVSADNGNASFGTFYEGAIVAGFPSDDTESAVLRNIKAVGYQE